MKRFLSALMALALFLSAALAEGDVPAQETQEIKAQETAEVAAPAEEPVHVEKPAPAEEPVHVEEPAPAVEPNPAEAEPVAAEPDPEDGESEESEAPAEGGAAPVDDMMFPEGEEPFVAPVPESPAKAEGYVMEGGQRVDGTLEELLAEAGEKTVYVSVKEPVEIKDFKLALLKGVELLPAPEVFGKDYAVALATQDGPLDAEDVASAVDETVTLTVSVVKEKKEKPAPGPDGQDKDEKVEVSLKVTPRGYADGAWQCEVPGFLLEGIPAGADGYSYAAIIYDERIVPMAGDEYFVREEGEWALRFAVLDALGDIVDKSEKYAVALDLTAPELMIEVSAERDYTMTLRAADGLSGVVELSLDGGESWVPLGEGESVVHTESRRKVFAPGTIQVRDLAGNVSANDEEVVLEAIPRMPAMGGWGGGYGGGDGGGSSAPAVPHASGDGDTAPYDAYELALPEGAVEVLTLGGEEIDLGLELDGEDFSAEGPARFTAELTAWAVASAAETAYAPPKDTLVVRAETGDAAGPYACTWRINGAVLRKLYNSEISYLILAAGDAMISLPTLGFTAGTRYAELKMEGVSTAEFAYEIVMRIDPNAEGPAPAEDGWNMASGCKPEIHVEVAGERFDMVDRVTTPEMYPFDVYCGPADLPEYPYGEYPRSEVEV